jgi:drug/metabolite transporter (DMT)-like permease
VTTAAPALELTAQRRGRAYVALAALAWSTAGVLQRALTLDTPTQLAGRAVFAVVGLVIYVALAERGELGRGFRAIGRDGLGIAVLMAVSSASFITALNHTTVANVLFLQALAPLMAAGLAFVALRERVSRRTLIAMGLAVVGVAVMVSGQGRPGPVGGGLALLMSFSFAATLVLARRARHVSMAPATCLSQALVLVAFVPFAHPAAVGGQDVGLLCLLGFGQMALGLIFLTLGAQLIPAAEVALITLLEIVLGPLWVLLSRSERPSAATLVGGVILLAAVAYQSFPSAVEYPR